MLDIMSSVVGWISDLVNLLDSRVVFQVAGSNVSLFNVLLAFIVLGIFTTLLWKGVASN